MVVYCMRQQYLHFYLSVYVAIQLYFSRNHYLYKNAAYKLYITLRRMNHFLIQCNFNFTINYQHIYLEFAWNLFSIEGGDSGSWILPIISYHDGNNKRAPSWAHRHWYTKYNDGTSSLSEQKRLVSHYRMDHLVHLVLVSMKRRQVFAGSPSIRSRLAWVRLHCVHWPSPC